MGLGFPVAPMKATLGSLPASDEGWAYEIKWDGHRTLVHLHDGTVRIQSGGGHDVGERWPEMLGIADAINASSAILDGELVVLGDDGLPRFDLIQRRHRRGAAAAASPASPDPGHVMFQAFDVLSLDGTDAIGLPYLDRRRLLASAIEPGPHWSVPDHHLGGGRDLVEATARLGLEGVVAKRVTSTYRVGGRSTEWRKIKHRRLVHLPIGGFTVGTGNRAHTFGALLVGRRPDGAPAETLWFAGGVGTGFDAATLDALTAQLRRLVTDECPFDPVPPRPIARTATWVRPVLTASIEIAEFTNDGHVRHASFVGLGDREA